MSRRSFKGACSLALLSTLGVLVALIAGCRGQTSTQPPIVVLRNMFDQDRYDPQQESKFFADGRTMRMPVADTVPRERDLDPQVAQGRLPDDSGYVAEIPRSVVDKHGGAAAMVARGQERYGIYCSPCHDGTGSGKGMVVTRANWQPALPTFHDERLRGIPDGQLFATITHGVRIMPSYGSRIPIADRWAIVSYVRALQLSQGE
jgi:mono/diheme cytochrome c family protein